ncbi:MAG: hypothetical protein ACRDRK_06765 [Pseudonocardia sp.]
MSVDAPRSLTVRPESLMGTLHRALLRLRGAAAHLADDTLDERIVEVLRRTAIAEFLDERLLVAVAGAQGAGKTTMVCECYGLDDTWLGSNAGRGERVPVMVVESKENPHVQGWAVVLDGADQVVTPLNPAKFHTALRGLSGGQLILGLTVPPAVFGVTGRGFLLLPGYEFVSNATREWQTLMRQALVTAPDAVVVVDQSLLASNSQEKLIADLRQSLGADARPIVVVSKTERLPADDPERVQLRNRAAQLFQLLPGDDVVLSGRGDANYRKVWLPRLRDALDRTLPSARQMRILQLEHLRTIVRQQVRDVHTRVSNAVVLHPLREEGVGYRIGLDAFDNAARQVAAEYGRFVLAELDRHRHRAYDHADRVLARRTETKQSKQEFVSFMTGRAYLYRRELEREFGECWQEAGRPGRGFAGSHATAVTDAIESSKPLVADLGWSVDSYVTVLRDLQALGGRGDSSYEYSDRLERNVALLPLMALEAVRTAAAASQLLSQKPASPSEHAPDPAAALNGIGEERLAMLAGFGSVLGADLGPKGTSGSPREVADALKASLFGTAQLSRAGTAAMSTLGVIVGAAALGLAAVNYENGRTRGKANMARNILDALHEAHQTKIEAEFGRLLRQLRYQVEFSLGRYFAVGRDTAHIIKVEHALANLKEARERMIDAFDDAV